MDDFELQRRLKELGLYRGEVDGVLGAESFRAIMAWLNFGRVAVRRDWSRARCALAAKQLICLRDGIDVGQVDGLMGPQTSYAFAVYAHRNWGAPSPMMAARATDPPTAEPAGAAPVWPRQADVEEYFGPIGAAQKRLILPFPMKLAWDRSKVVRSFLVHEKVHDSARRCFARIAAAYDAARREETGIDLFGGAFNVRKMRGSERWSMHSWGIAIDFDPDRNGLHSTQATARLAQPDCEAFWRIWEEEGWVSLGRTRNFDWMHVQAARL
jgi:hypothetical protein